MSYNKFKKLDQVRQQLSLFISSGASLFAETPEVAPGEHLRQTLRENVPLALNINSEKARSEMIVAPVLIETRRAMNRGVSLFSGLDFDVDRTQGLNGYCDFLISNSPNQVFIEAPVVCLVEAKKESLQSGYPQCIAEMVAAQLFNKQHGRPLQYVLGVVTMGSEWKFLTLRDKTVFIDFDDYHISQVAKILGILVAALHDNATPKV